MTTTSPLRSYDATAILNFGAPSDEPLPNPKPGEIVIRYGGWSLQALRDSPVGQKLMHQQDWYNSESFGTASLPPGTYRLRIPVPNSHRKTFAEQEAMLPAGESPAPAVLVATALLCHKLQTGEDLLKSDWTRCNERAAGGYRVALTCYGGRLSVRGGGWVAVRSADIWLSAVGTS